MADVEMVYSARQVTAELEMTPQMAGKYFQAFEKITKTKIKKAGREGRQFDAATRDVLISARDLVRSSSGLTVEEAVKRALMYVTDPQPLEPWGDGSGFDLERLRAVLSEAITAPLVAQLEELRKSHEAVRRELAELKAINRENQKALPSRVFVAPIDNAKEELERLNGYLLGELQRRRFEADAEKERRPWWRFWKTK